MFFARVTPAKDVHHSSHPKILGPTEEEAADELLVRDHRDPSHYTGLLKQYVMFSKYPLLFVDGEYEYVLSIMVTFAILLAAASIGMETYEEYEGSTSIEVVNNCVLGVFILEFVLKIMSEGAYPQHYFTGPQRYWNIFDFVLIVITLPISDELNAGAVSRVFRLFRILKVARRIQALQVIINGLLSGMSSIFFITILLSLVYYMYAVLGVFIFRESDPFFFGSIPRAIIGLFRACTLENWGANMYISYYGCSIFRADIYNTRSDFDNEVDWLAVPVMYRCEHPKAFYIVAFLYWVSFIVVSSLVMLSLFIGVITLAMQASMTDMKEEIEEQVRQKRVLEAQKAFDSFKVDKERTNSMRRPGLLGMAQSLSMMSIKSLSGLEEETSVTNKDMNTVPVLSVQERRKQNDLEQMRRLLMQAWEGTAVADAYKSNLAKEGMESTSQFIHWLGAMCRGLLQHPVFYNSVTAVIIIAGIMIGIDADLGDRMSPSMSAVLRIMETIILTVFCIEFVIRVGADEFHIHEFIKSNWNIFDGVVILGSFLPQGGPLLMILRLLRLLRVLKLLKAFPRLAVIVGALLKGLGSIGYIGIIIIIGFYIFAIIGSILFHDNDLLHFENVHIAFMTLCQMATLDSWGEHMMKNIYGCDMYPNPYFASELDVEYCLKPYAFGVVAAIYYVIFVIIGSLVMLTLFVGVVTTSMDEAAAEQAEEKEVEQKIAELCLQSSVSGGQLEVYRRVFKILDADGGGSIDSEELKLGLSSIDINPTPDELDRWILDVDINGDGVVDIVEFITFMTNMKERHVGGMGNTSIKMDSTGHEQPNYEHIETNEEDETAYNNDNVPSDEGAGSPLNETDCASGSPIPPTPLVLPITPTIGINSSDSNVLTISMSKSVECVGLTPPRTELKQPSRDGLPVVNENEDANVVKANVDFSLLQKDGDGDSRRSKRRSAPASKMYMEYQAVRTSGKEAGDTMDVVTKVKKIVKPNTENWTSQIKSRINAVFLRKKTAGTGDKSKEEKENDWEENI